MQKLILAALVLLCLSPPSQAQPAVGEEVRDAHGNLVWSSRSPQDDSLEQRQRCFLIWIWNRQQRQPQNNQESEALRREIESLRQQLALSQQQIASLMALAQRGPVQTPAPQAPQIILLNPYQQLPVEPRPRQELPVEPRPKQELPVEPRPRQDLPVEPRPKQELPPEPKPRQELPIDGKPKQPLPAETKPYAEPPGISKPAPSGYQRYTKAVWRN